MGKKRDGAKKKPSSKRAANLEEKRKTKERGTKKTERKSLGLREDTTLPSQTFQTPAEKRGTQGCENEKEKKPCQHQGRTISYQG